MYCLGCGCKLDLGAKFCSHCGKPTAMAKEKNTGKITVTRPSNFFGCAIPFEAYIDGSNLGTLSNGAILSCNAAYGVHELVLKSTEQDVVEEIVLSENQKEAVVEVTVTMGLIAAKPRIKNVIYN